MKLCNSEMMREMDNYAINVLGIPGATLMTRAAQHVADAALEQINGTGRVAAFCGSGNNGGDGIGAAAILTEKGIPVRVFLTGNAEKLTADSREMLSRLTAAGGKLEKFSECNVSGTETLDVEEYLKSCDVIIDAMFGIGLNSDLRGDALKAVELINAADAYVIAADIPSGVHADTGAVMGSAVKAEATVTFTMEKPGLTIEPGRSCCGEILVKDIGIPDDAWYAVLGVEHNTEKDPLDYSFEILKTNTAEIRYS